MIRNAKSFIFLQRKLKNQNTYDSLLVRFQARGKTQSEFVNWRATSPWFCIGELTIYMVPVVNILKALRLFLVVAGLSMALSASSFELINPERPFKVKQSPYPSSVGQGFDLMAVR